MTKKTTQKQAKFCNWFQKAKSFLLGKQPQAVQLSNKTIDDLLYAINQGVAYEYLNDVEPSNNLVLC